MLFHKKHRFDSFGQLILGNINISTLEIEQKQIKSQKEKKKKKKYRQNILRSPVFI